MHSARSSAAILGLGTTTTLTAVGGVMSSAARKASAPGVRRTGSWAVASEAVASTSMARSGRA